MIREGRFRCEDCGLAGEPTLIFQRCPTCEGKLVLIHRRYRCRDYGEDVTSRFLFDGVVYDAAYFRLRMAQSRQRQKQQKIDSNERQATRAWQRSPHAAAGEIRLDQAPGLVEVLNQLVGGQHPETVAWVREAFDLAAYERHILSELRTDDHRDLMKLPGLDGQQHPTSRLERVRLFIASLFLEHAGLVVLNQRPHTIWVTLRETD